MSKTDISELIMELQKNEKEALSYYKEKNKKMISSGFQIVKDRFFDEISELENQCIQMREKFTKVLVSEKLKKKLH